MKIAAWIDEDGHRHTVSVENDGLHHLAGNWQNWTKTGQVTSFDNGRLACPVTPRTIVCVGLNYRLHALESGLPVPELPALFIKLPSALIADREDILRPAQTTKLDYEAELGVVIGTTAASVPVSQALAHVAGYVTVNDVSARDLQRDEGYGWVRGKSSDTFCPVGPYVVTCEDVMDPQNLRIRTFVNGQPRQDSTTADMVFNVAELIAFVSETITLHPGDLLCTGTPSGVGDGMTPPAYLTDGDHVVIDIEGLGRLENTVRNRP